MLLNIEKSGEQDLQTFSKMVVKYLQTSDIYRQAKMDDEDNGIDVPRVDEGIGNIQILQASDMMQGETITLSLENAAQLILQHQGLQGIFVSTLPRNKILDF